MGLIVCLVLVVVVVVLISSAEIAKEMFGPGKNQSPSAIGLEHQINKDCLRYKPRRSLRGGLPDQILTVSIHSDNYGCGVQSTISTMAVSGSPFSLLLKLP